MNTNAALLDKKKTDEILQSGLDRINFHISGFSRKTYEDIMIGLDYKSVMKNVLDFIDVSKKSNSRIVVAVKYVVLEENRHELEDAKIFWESKGVLFRPDVLDDRLGALLNYNKIRPGYDKMMENTVCPLIFEQMFIRHNGDVVSCWSDWYDKRIFGNCNYSSISNIFNSSRLNELRIEHINNNKYCDNICSKCHWIDKEKYEI
jgi:radical SAM protein with 4Fe4S-binding SPASM domain